VNKGITTARYINLHMIFLTLMVRMCISGFVSVINILKWKLRILRILGWLLVILIVWPFIDPKIS
jgi:hypothetical protein